MQGSFTFLAVGPVQVKKQEPAVYKLQRAKPVIPNILSLHDLGLTLVGRKTEMTHLQAMMDVQGTRQRHIVGDSGETGIDKSQPTVERQW